MEGAVEVRRSGTPDWAPVQQGDTFCVGDSIRLGAFSRGALLLPDETPVRLEQNTVATIVPPQDDKRSWLEILRGAVYILTRDPRAVQILTPFANAGIEGTEFLVQVGEAVTTITVFEGDVEVTNTAGQASVGSGESVTVAAGQLPVAQVVVQPRNAVQWTLYYSPVLSQPLPAPDAAPAPQQTNDASFYTARAAARLSVGRAEEASADIDAALSRAPTDPDALALQAIIAVARNDASTALDVANRAVTQNPDSAAALIAQSYARQAAFDVSGALVSLQQAVERAPDDALAWARLAELWLAVGDVEQSLQAARQAVTLDPNVARTHTVLGFTNLARVELAQARAAFERAIALDQAAPLPRLGLGLASIRAGELVAGRREIEIAAALDPNNALVRSYLGKAYYEEKRSEPAGAQLAIAKEIDPLDPTPWLYDAIRKHTLNRPGDALVDIQRSIDLNDNRAVYRSRLLLDRDEASRSASVGRIFNHLGFEHLGLLEGWKSTTSDPANHSAHRLLADSLGSRPRHEVARVDELFQSQLLQPLNATPVPPQLAETNLFILDSAGPTDLSFNEFNPLFNRNRVTLQGSGVIGDHGTRGEDVTVSGIVDRWSFSVGQFHFETDGFRENNDLEQDVVNGFVQFRLADDTTVLAELRHSDREQGDLELLFDPQNFDPRLRQTESIESLRLGFRHTLALGSDVIGSLVYQQADVAASSPPVFALDLDVAGYTLELQHLYRRESWHLISGVRYIDRDEDQLTRLSYPDPFAPFDPLVESVVAARIHNEHITAYVYGKLGLGQGLSMTLGISTDFLDGRIGAQDRVNPKLGLLWEPRPGRTLRAGAFRTMQAASFSRQDIQPRLEPTHVATFNQWFRGDEGERAWRYGIGWDERLADNLFFGVEFSRRDLTTPVVPLEAPDQIVEVAIDEGLNSAYLYWLPLPSLAVSAVYRYEDRDVDNPQSEFGREMRLSTHQVPLSVDYFHASGFSAGLTARYVDQSGRFVSGDDQAPSYPGSDRFWVLDASVGYRLPRRHGVVTAALKNLFDEDFRFQDTDPENPRVMPDRLFLLRFTLAL